MRTIALAARIHARILIDEPARPAEGLILAFHGYAESPEHILPHVRAIPGTEAWKVVAPMGLHRFYRKGRNGTEDVVASWMTREDREHAIADALHYIDQVIGAELPTTGPMIFVGFSQGASMAYRAALLGAHRPSGIVALGGDIPPEVRDVAGPWPAVIVGAGQYDPWYDDGKRKADEAVLVSRDVDYEIVAFDGAHEWTTEFSEAVGRWIARSQIARQR